MSSRSTQAAARAAARAAEQKAQARKRQTIRVTALTVGLAVVAALAATAAATQDSAEDPSAAAASTSPEQARTTAPPWPALPDGLQARTAGLAFPPVGDESYHAHALLSVYRNGRPVQVPANIGFDRSGAHSSLHTHTPDGVVHMEADEPYPYSLQEFFTVWGVAFSFTPGSGRLGSDTPNSSSTVHVYVNGKPAPAGPVPMTDGDNIVVAYGPAGSFPTAPPTSALNTA